MKKRIHCCKNCNIYSIHYQLNETHNKKYPYYCTMFVFNRIIIILIVLKEL